jgi:hypothetical protein
LLLPEFPPISSQAPTGGHDRVPFVGELGTQRFTGAIRLLATRSTKSDRVGASARRSLAPSSHRAGPVPATVEALREAIFLFSLPVITCAITICRSSQNDAAARMTRGVGNGSFSTRSASVAEAAWARARAVRQRVRDR